MDHRRLALVLLAALTLLAPVVASAQNSPFPYTSATTLQNAATANGNGTAMNVGLMQVLGVQVVLPSTGTATVTPEGSLNGTNWSTIACYPSGSSTASTAPAIGIFRCDTLGVPLVRMRLSSYGGTGAINVYGFATSAGPLPVNIP